MGIPDELKIPYIRIRIEYSGGYSVIAPRIFARYIEGRVANPQDCIIFFKNKGFAGGATQQTQKGGKSRVGT